MSSVPREEVDPALRHVHIVGTGLIGTSIGLGLRARGVFVTLEDPSPTALAMARDLGAGDPTPLDPQEQPGPSLVVVAAPPDVAASVVLNQLRRWSAAVVTDVASVKAAVLDALERAGCGSSELARYVGSHPMAGRERSGAIGARSDLFEGRPWVICAAPRTDLGARRATETLARTLEAVVRRMAAEDHDAAVAAVSHVPQVASSLVASRLRELPADSVSLAGQGLRDVTRIAASEPVLWTQILAGNAAAVREVLEELATDVAVVLDALRALEHDPDAAVGARAMLARVIADGNAGYVRIPGKHGGGPTRYAVVQVLIPDSPGELARLFNAVGAGGVNIEDLQIEHEYGRLAGIAELTVLPQAADALRALLREQGWTVYD
ncbi:MAG: prephenate dehydrogenase [Austwickia sp.]|nr:prephenate dehydrogenase [Austwickia sp.]